MAIDYSKLLLKHGVPNHSFFYFQDRGNTIIAQVTPQTRRNILKDQKRAQKKGLTFRDNPSDHSNVVPLWAYKECDGPQTYEQFTVTKFKSTALAEEVLSMLQRGARPTPPPAPAPTPAPQQKKPEPFVISGSGASEPQEPQQPEQEQEAPEEIEVDLHGMRMADLRAYAIQQGIPEDDVNAYRGNRGKQELIERLTTN